MESMLGIRWRTMQLRKSTSSKMVRRLIEVVKEAVVSTVGNGAHGEASDPIPAVTLADFPGTDVFTVGSVYTVVGVALGHT